MFSGSAGSPIIGYTISGSGIFDASGTTTFNIEIDLSYDAFGPAFNGTDFNVTGGGTLTNTSTSQSANITSFRLTDGGGADTDDLRFDLDSVIAINTVQTYAISGSGTFDVSSVGATFDDLTPGTGTFDNTFSLFEEVNLTVTPEPSRALLSLLGLGMVLARRRRK